MEKTKDFFGKPKIKKTIIDYGLLTIVYLVGYKFSIYNNFLAFLILIVASVSYYFYFSLTPERSFLKFKAVFSGVWLCTIGLAQLRFLEYQVVWTSFTWINLCVSHLSFLLANDLSHKYFYIFEDKFSLTKINKMKLPFKYEVKPQRYFWIATITTLTGIICLAINVAIKGYIPFFAASSDTNAYLNFYTRFHTFVVASLVSGGLSYYCIKKYQLSRIKKIFLSFYIVLLVFIIPILLVQRGTFITAALILTAAIYLLSNRKFWVLLMCIVVMLGIYQFGSYLRGYSDAQLNEFFKPKEIINETGKVLNPTNQISNVEINKEKNPDNVTNNTSNASNETNNDEVNNATNSSKDVANTTNSLNTKGTFKLPPKAAFFYSYLTVSQDNFNSAVTKKTVNTWGVWQLKPFNVVLRSKWINDKLAYPEHYAALHQVLPHLNTYNLISMAYYDFGIIGVIIFTLLWSFCFGLVEAFYSKYKGAFSCLAYGVCLTPVALCFMNPWLSNFTPWLLWGTVFLMFLAGSFTLKKQNSN